MSMLNSPTTLVSLIVHSIQCTSFLIVTLFEFGGLGEYENDVSHELYVFF